MRASTIDRDTGRVVGGLTCMVFSVLGTAGCGTTVSATTSDIGMDIASPSDAGFADDAATTDTPATDLPLPFDQLPPIDAAVTGTCPDGMAFVPPGSFIMGDSDFSSAAAQPPHLVTLTHAFCLDRTEVTVDAYRACVGNGCATPVTGQGCDWMSGFGDHPMNCVNWAEARQYCQLRGGDLPTEAQWEFSARGTDGRTYPWGNESPDSQVCWRRFYDAGTCPVASYPPTLHGLFDLSGNVAEWVLDWLAPYPATAVVDPTGPSSGELRVTRGGSKGLDQPILLRSAYRRDVSTAMYGHADIGFRCVHAPL